MSEILKTDWEFAAENVDWLIEAGIGFTEAELRYLRMAGTEGTNELIEAKIAIMRASLKRYLSGSRCLSPDDWIELLKREKE